MEEQFNSYNYWKIDHGLIIDEPEPPVVISVAAKTAAVATIAAKK